MKKPILIALSLVFTSFAAYAEDNGTTTYQRDDSSKVIVPAPSELKGAAPDNVRSGPSDNTKVGAPDNIGAESRDSTRIGSPETRGMGVPDNARVVAPDNTKINARDRSNQTLTSGNQSNSKRDLKLTSTIRRSIVKSELTTLAKNIKIITVNGNVTLRGPVNTEAEKEKIGSLASSVRGVNQLDNQLEVKSISNLTTKE